jgi:tetratricopeptide (TPR) repeat protein
MRRAQWGYIFFIFLLSACASVNKDLPDGTVPLEEALRIAGSEIVNSLRQGRRVAVVNFDSGSPEFSNYLIEELIGQLIKDKKLLIVDRNNLNLIFKELDFNMSGHVSDETAAGVGKMAGAQTIISGSILDTGNAWRLRVIAIEVESSIREASAAADVRKDPAFERMVAGIQSGKIIPSLPEDRDVYIDEADISFTAAYTAYMMGDYDQALADFTAAISSNPSFAYAYLYRGLAYKKKHDYKQSIENINKAIEIYPKFAKAYFYRGEAYGSAKNYDLAIADFTRAIAINPDNAEFYYNRGMAYGFKEDYESELADYTRAISLNPNYAEAYHLRGGVYSIQGKLDLAIKDFTTAIAIKPDYIKAYELRGILYNYIGKYYQAIEDFTQILKLDPNNREAKERIELIRRKIQ